MGSSFGSFLKWQDSIFETLTNVISLWHFFSSPFRLVNILKHAQLWVCIQLLRLCIIHMVLPELRAEIALKKDLQQKKVELPQGLWCSKALALGEQNELQV